MVKKLLLDTPSVFGVVVVSGLAGLVGSFLGFFVIKGITGAKEHDWREFSFTGVFTGICERMFFTLMIGLLGEAGIAQSAIAWIAIKGQVQ